MIDTHNTSLIYFILTASCAQHFLLPDERLVVVKYLIFFSPLAIPTLLQKCTSQPMTSLDLPKISSTLLYKITWHQFLFLRIRRFLPPVENQQLELERELSSCRSDSHFCRMWLYMHHIYSKTKRRNILALWQTTCSCPDSIFLVKGLHIGNFLFNQYFLCPLGLYAQHP